MQVRLLTVAQEFSCETGSTHSYAVLELPGGDEIRALISEESLQLIVSNLVVNGGAVAQAALQHAASAPPPTPRQAAAPERVEEEREFFPMRASNDETDGLVSTFGGDYSKEGASIEDPLLEAVGAQLEQAEATLARAIGDTSTLSGAALRDVVSKLAAEPVQQVRRTRAPVVQADAMGNPIITGPGRVDIQDITGGDLSDEEDAGQA